jgi:outer membrane protein OmpA-like peptidoglycan-associated protein
MPVWFRIVTPLRVACAVALVLVAGCASQPRGKSPSTPAVPALVAHGLVSPVQVRVDRIKALLRSGVVPLERHAVAGYLDALDARLRGAIAGNTADIVRVDRALVVVLPARVIFGPDVAELTPAGEKFLAAIAEVLRGESALMVEAACHTDRLGEAADNEAFSKRRAELARDTLAAHGLDALRVITVGPGDHYPVADNATADGRRRNRRVELSLVPIVR